MTVLRLEHIGIVVDDLAAATAFFAALGLELEGEASVEGDLVDRINGLDDVRAGIVILRTPDGHAKVELAKYRAPLYESDDAPPPANAPGIRHTVLHVWPPFGGSVVADRTFRRRPDVSSAVHEARGQVS